MEVRAAVLDDLPAAESVRIATWQVAYRGIVSDAFLDALSVSEERLERLRGRFGGEVSTYLAVHESEVVGMASRGPCRDDDRPGENELYALYVLPSHWGSGAGQQLLDACGDVSSLWVLERNARARSFYERNGFQPDGHVMPVQFEPTVTEVRYVRPPSLT